MEGKAGRGECGFPAEAGGATPPDQSPASIFFAWIPVGADLGACYLGFG